LRERMKGRIDSMGDLQELRGEQPRFLAVGDEAEVSYPLVQMLADKGHSGEVCATADRALERLENTTFQGVLCDHATPGMGGMKLLGEVRISFPDVAFVMIAESGGVRQGVLAMIAGASDYLLKPLQADAVDASLLRALKRKRLERGLERYRSRQGEKMALRKPRIQLAPMPGTWNRDEAIELLGRILNLRDHQASFHCQRVMSYSLELAKAMQCTQEESSDIVRGAYLHDIGKVCVSDEILLKPGLLTKEERESMQVHARIGFDLLRSEPLLARPAQIVLSHHERFDGEGYPQGLAGKNIPLGARIFAVANALDAMTSDRPYRKALQYSAARDEIVRQAGRQFDPEVVDAFLRIPQESWNRLRAQAQLGVQAFYK
jgi:response regulator RpfG family c-di-GMP phosphodiesterase